MVNIKTVQRCLKEAGINKSNVTPEITEKVADFEAMIKQQDEEKDKTKQALLTKNLLTLEKSLVKDISDLGLELDEQAEQVEAKAKAEQEEKDKQTNEAKAKADAEAKDKADAAALIEQQRLAAEKRAGRIKPTMMIGRRY